MAAYDEETVQALRIFGGQLKHWRGLRGFTQEDLGRAVSCSADLIASIEQGRRVARPPFYDLADEALGAQGSIKAVEKHILQRTRYPAFFAEFAEQEQCAVGVDYYGSLAIPGLLQTEAYARAVIGAFSPMLDEDEIERLVAARMERRRLLDRRPPAMLGFVIDEAVLQRPLGGSAVLKEQLSQVVHIAKNNNNVTLQVLPLDCEENAGLDGSFSLLETGERQMVTYIEHPGGGQWMAKPEEFSLLHQRYGIIRAQALTIRDSLALIEKVAGEL